MTMRLLYAMSAITLYHHQFLSPGGLHTELFYPSFARNQDLDQKALNYNVTEELWKVMPRFLTA